MHDLVSIFLVFKFKKKNPSPFNFFSDKKQDINVYRPNISLLSSITTDCVQQTVTISKHTSLSQQLYAKAMFKSKHKDNDHIS